MASPRKVGGNKLNNIKEYWTVSEVAQYLSDIGETKIGEADVLRLVLKGKLKLSVNIQKNMAAKYCPNTGADASGRQEEQPANFLTTFIKKQKDEGKICHIEGIYDLLMIGGGVLDVESALQKLDGGSASKRISSRGTYVEGVDGQVYQLQENVKDENPELFNNQNALPEFPPPPKATMSFDPPESHEQPESADSPQSLKDIPRPKLRSTPDIFRPAGCLPKESKFLVRTSALRELKEGFTVEDSEELAEEELESNTRGRTDLGCHSGNQSESVGGRTEMSASAGEEPLITIKVIADFLKVSPSTVKNYMKKVKSFPYHKTTGRIEALPSELEKWRSKKRKK